LIEFDLKTQKERVSQIREEVFDLRPTHIYGHTHAEPRLATIDTVKSAELRIFDLEEQNARLRDTTKHLEERVVLLKQGLDEAFYAIRAWIKEHDGVEQRLTELEHEVKDYVQPTLAKMVQEDSST
jgi:hypothetical protein